MLLKFTTFLPAKLKQTCRFILRYFLQIYSIIFAALQTISPISNWVNKQLRMFTNKKEPTTILYHQSINTRRRLQKHILNSNSTNKNLQRDHSVVLTIIGVIKASSTMLSVSSGSLLGKNSACAARSTWSLHGRWLI